MSSNIETMPRKKGRPSTKLSKLNDIKNAVSNEDIKLKVDNLINSIATGNSYNNIKRGIDFLKSHEQTYENADEYNKEKMLYLSKKLAKGQIKQLRRSNTLLNLLLSGKGDVKRKFEKEIKIIKAQAGKAEITTESAMKSRVKDIILKFDKKAKGFKPLDQLFKRIPDIKASMNVNGAITLQINVSLIVGFTDGTIDTFHIHSDKTNILINSEENIKKEIEKPY